MEPINQTAAAVAAPVVTDQRAIVIEAVREGRCSLAVAWGEDGLGRTEAFERKRADCLKQRAA
jgi:hypothetical protein